MLTERRSQRRQWVRHLVIDAAGLAILAPAATMSIAQPPERVIVDVSGCLDLESREQQLECYEALVTEELRSGGSDGREGSDRQRDDAVAVAAGEEPDENPSREPSDDSSENRSEEPIQEPSDARGEIVAKIESFRELEPNTYLIYLDNDQVWRQNRPKRYLLREGAEVRLRPTRWGTSYRLIDPNAGGFIQVERVR